MWLSLFALVLILTITFFQGLQGVFSALISCVLTILAASLAIGFYEDLYFTYLMQFDPERGRAIALLAIFFVSLLILRILFDVLIRGNMQFSLYVDRIGGGLLGFVTAMITVGMLAISLHMLPFGLTFMGYSRYTLVDTSGNVLAPGPDDQNSSMGAFRASLDWSKVKHSRRNIWLNPDGFTVAVLSYLSDNALQGRSRLSMSYPDLLRSAYNARSAPSGTSRKVVEPGSLRVTSYWDMPPKSFYVREPDQERDTGYKMPQYIKLVLPEQPAEPGNKLMVVRATIGADAVDFDRNHHFTTEQVRLVGLSRKDGPAQEYYLAGINFEQIPRWIRLYRGECVTRPGPGALEVDFVFEVPDVPEFKPLFVEYKQNARAELPASMDKTDEGPPLPLNPAAKEEKAKKGAAKKKRNRVKPKTPVRESRDARPSRRETRTPTSPRQDRISSLGPARKESAFGNQLPFALTNYTGSQIEASDGKLLGARHLYAELQGDWQPRAGGAKTIETFEVPDSSRLLQLSVEKLQPESWIGKIYGGIIGTIRDFYLVDEGGKEFMPVGSYAMAMVNGKATFELIYLDETARGFARLPKFKRIKPDHMKGKYSLYFLFHVPPGTKAQKLHTGRKDVDLRNLNLVAPQ